MNFIIFVFIIDILLIFLIFGAFWGVIWLPTQKKDYERIAKMAILKSNDVFYDLGSGSGDLLFYLEKKYDIRCVGIEISPILYFYSKIRSLFHEKVEIRYGDFFRQDISEADVIYAFLLPRMYKKLEAKIKKDAKEEAKIILAVWPLSDKSSTRSTCEKGEVSYYLYKNKRVFY